MARRAMYRLLRRLVVTPVALFAACGPHQVSREQQLENCLVISHSGDELTRCLVMKYDWNGREAFREGEGWQARLDSVGRSLAQAESSRRAAVLAELRVEDSLAQVRGSLAALEEEARRRSYLQCFTKAADSSDVRACDKRWIRTRVDSMWARDALPRHWENP